MVEGRTNSVDIRFSKTLVLLKRVRSLRDPGTNSMSKFAMTIDNMNLDLNSGKGAYLGATNGDKLHGLQEREDFGSDSVSDRNSIRKSSMVRVRGPDSRNSYFVRKPYRHRKKKLVEPNTFPEEANSEEETNSCSEQRIDRAIGRKKPGYHGWRKPYAAVEDAVMSRIGTPCVSMSESRTNCSSWSTIGLPTEEVDVVDSSYNGCGISYCWSRTPRYRDPNLSPNVQGENHPLLSAEERETASREIKPYPESPRCLSQKFRPRSFSDLVGLSGVSNSLLHAISKGRIALVYLFDGPRGTGKTSTARILAAALNCLSLEEHRPCGFCRECVLSFSGRSRDVKELDAAKINRKDRITAIIKSASLSTFSSRVKVFIIDECQFLKREAWDVIFDSVEKLSRHSVFVMITTDPAKLPRSSVSQCQRYHFPKIEDVDISFRLQKLCLEEGLEYDKDALDFIAAKSNGSLRDAETILDQLGLLGKKITLSIAYELIGVVSDKELLNLLDLALSSDTTNTVIRARDLMRSRVDPMQLISQLANLIMDILSGRCQTGFCEGKSLFDTHDLTDVGMQKLRHALKVLSETEKQLRTSKNQATWLTVALLQFGYADNEKFCSSSPRDSLKNSVCHEGSHRNTCPGSNYDSTKLETIWRRTSRKCQSSSFRNFLQKEGNLSSVCISEGLAIAEIEFFHPHHVSRAEKSWKLIAHSLEDVLGCNVEIRLKLASTCMGKNARVKKLSFSLLSCSGRNCQMSESSMTDGNETDTSTRREICFGAYSSRPEENLSSFVDQLEAKSVKEGSCFHDKEAVIIRNQEEDTRSNRTASDRGVHVNTVKVYKLRSESSKEVSEMGQYDSIQEHEHQPSCFAKTLKFRRKFLSSDAAQAICLRVQPHSRQELPIPKKAASEPCFSTHDPYRVCSRLNAEVTYSSGEQNVQKMDSKFGKKLLCWQPPKSGPKKKVS